MKKVYGASDILKKLLKYPPKAKMCLSGREIATIKNLNNMVIFLWLKSGKGYWYHVHYVNGDTLVGYRLMNNQWYFNPVQIRNILSYY